VSVGALVPTWKLRTESHTGRVPQQDQLDHLDKVGTAYPNPSGISPRGRAVLLRDYSPELGAGKIEIPAHVRYTQMLMNQRAVVIEVDLARERINRGPERSREKWCW
jgi:hypothetical protein